MRLVIHDDDAAVATFVAEYVVNRINTFAPTADRPFVLGLPTGSSPVKTYKRIVEMHKAGKVSFEHVVTFNMDEYVNLARDHTESYHSFMWRHLVRDTDCWIARRRRDMQGACVGACGSDVSHLSTWRGGVLTLRQRILVRAFASLTPPDAISLGLCVLSGAMRTRRPPTVCVYNVCHLPPPVLAHRHQVSVPHSWL